MRATCAEDYGLLAEDRLNPEVWDFIAGGSGAELTVRANSQAFDTTSIRPRVLVDVSTTSTATTLLGSSFATPIGIAPTAYHQLFHPTGELGMAGGAGAAGSLFVVSMFASQPLEKIAAAASSPLWLQLYWLRRRDAMVGLAQRAQAAGYQAIVLTVDVPQMGRRLRDLRNSFVLPADVRAVNLDEELMASAYERIEGTSSVAVHTAHAFDPSITWSDLSWLKGVTDLPLVLKGILTAADAARAVDHGADAIIVSNHGGRQLDGAVPTLHALPEVVAAVDGAIPVLLDGGVRRGRDVFIALALGAKAVLIGRPSLWALSTDGAAGVTDLLGLLTEELAHTMALAGRPRLTDICADAVVTGGG